MGTVTVKCGRCGGTGRVGLARLYADTYRRVVAAGGEVTGADLARQMGVKATAMNNRLVALERHGLLTSRRDGRERYFRVVTQGAA